MNTSEAAEAHINVCPKRGSDWQAQIEHSVNGLSASNFENVNCVIHVAGGFVGGALKDGISNVQQNWQMNGQSAFNATYIASKVLQQGGLLSITGAAGALDKGLDYAVGYAMSKAATHSLVRSIAKDMKALPEGSKIVCITPTVIDTPANRKSMPNANFEDWSKPDDIANMIVSWCTKEQPFPPDLFVKV